MLEQYWIILLPVAVVTGIFYFYLMRIKKYAVDQYFRNRIWTYEIRNDWIQYQSFFFKLFFMLQLGVFLILDWFLNVLLTVPMLDLPSSFFELTTGRMRRYRNMNDETFMGIVRIIFANFVCKHLNKADKGHC